MIERLWRAFMPHRLNLQIAERLRDMSDLLEEQGEVGFRAVAYRRAADVVGRLGRSVEAILADSGREGLVALPAVGQGIAAAIAEMVATGRWSALDRLTGTLDPESLLATLPGIGNQTAQRLHRELHVDTLEELEVAANDGRLDQLAGFGPRRLAAIRAALRDRLRLLRGRLRSSLAPSVRVLLEVDRRYREGAARNELKLIAPRRFNPQGLAWLPVMHVHQRAWHFTALYSNTARAHALNKTRGWVVIVASHSNAPDSQFTVVTETRAPMKGKRMVRGREAECETYYNAMILA
jgi:putative hydrolase